MNEEELKNLVISIMRSLSVDYPVQWKKDYKSQDDKKQLRSRLLQLLKDFQAECIVEGYENCIAKHPDYMPTIPSIIAYIADAMANQKRKLKNQEELNQIPELPAPKKTRMSGQDILNMLSEALKAPTGPESERLERLKLARESHDTLIADHIKRGLIRKPSITPQLCAKCGRPGVLSHSTSGGGNLYCGEHFQVSL